MTNNNPSPESEYDGQPLPDGLAKSAMQYLIDRRRIAAYKNPKLLTDKKHRMDQSDIFYPARMMLYRKGYDVSSLAEGEKRK